MKFRNFLYIACPVAGFGVLGTLDGAIHGFMHGFRTAGVLIGVWLFGMFCMIGHVRDEKDERRTRAEETTSRWFGPFDTAAAQADDDGLGWAAVPERDPYYNL